jgi:hypothetical protein
VCSCVIGCDCGGRESVPCIVPVCKVLGEGTPVMCGLCLWVQVNERTFAFAWSICLSAWCNPLPHPPTHTHTHSHTHTHVRTPTPLLPSPTLQNGSLRKGLPNLLNAAHQSHQQHLQKHFPPLQRQQQQQEGRAANTAVAFQGSGDANAAGVGCSDPTLLPFLDLAANKTRSGGGAAEEGVVMPMHKAAEVGRSADQCVLLCAFC